MVTTKDVHRQNSRYASVVLSSTAFKMNLVTAQLLSKCVVRSGRVKLQVSTQLILSHYLQHVEEQTPEFGSFHHEKGHFVTELGCRGSKAAVCHRFLVDGLDYLP